jgi:hypothetical protein
LPASDHAAALRAAKEALEHFRAQLQAQEARAKDKRFKGKAKGYDPITLHGPAVGAVGVLLHIAEQQQEELARLDEIVNDAVDKLVK